MSRVSIGLVLLLFNCVLSSIFSNHNHRYVSRHHSLRYEQRLHPLSDQYIDSINARQNLWTAGRNFHRNTPLSYLKSLAGTIVRDSTDYDAILGAPPKCRVTKPLPKSFDARENWPFCKTINETRDQGGCGSCWAMGVASVMTDRICTLTRETEVVYFSEEDILQCCPNCLMSKSAMCKGGLLEKGWAFATKFGVVSGGGYRAKGGCKSYEFRPCDHNKKSGRKGPCREQNKNRRCTERCTDNAKIDYETDKKRFSNSYRVKDPMCEIHEYGPITAVMTVYDDFISYKNGVYRKTDDSQKEFIGNHTVKIIGWGVEERTNTKYWLAANSWNSDWGDNGFFKIARDVNECNIEKLMIAGKL